MDPSVAVPKWRKIKITSPLLGSPPPRPFGGTPPKWAEIGENRIQLPSDPCLSLSRFSLISGTTTSLLV